MKKILLVAVAAVLFACTPKQDGYTIKGTISGEGVNNGSAYLSNFSRVDPIRDTAEFKNGTFIFKGNVATPDNYAITVEGLEGRIVLFLDNSKIEIKAEKDNLANAEVTGGVTNDLIIALNKSLKEIETKNNLKDLESEFYDEKTTSERKEAILKSFEEAQKEMDVIKDDFFAANPTSFFTITQLGSKVESYPIEEMEAIIAKFEALPEFAGNSYLASLKESVNTLKSLQPGMQAPDFTLNDPEGNPISLSDVYPKNKITMIDFWAGWCSPCRNFNPKLVEMYKKYSKDGFGIFGVSFDRDEQVWKDAIKDDKLTWPQVSDLKFWDSAPSKEYYVTSIPANIFVDQDGKIIKRKVGRNEMDSFIKEQLGL
ncbi:MAG: redoxin domain-containing protein [Bacteroidales bacterium]|nr:redoxin family protein [Bacteroidales bacterium]MDD4655895.1 redoxin family protein [Bacteroidales bacterium]